MTSLLATEPLYLLHRGLNEYRSCSMTPPVARRLSLG